MTHIVLGRSAIDKLKADPKLRLWQQGQLENVVPVLSHFRRAYTTKPDGTIIEHGDGFTLDFVPPNDVCETDDIAFVKVAVASEVEILVKIERSILSGDILIKYRIWTYRWEPLGR